ncbi:MAG TPA: hypothetical protein VGB89_09065 [Bacteroidota bacterium]
MNRSFYLVDPWFDRSTLQVDSASIAELRKRFLHAINLLKWNATLSPFGV